MLALGTPPRAQACKTSPSRGDPRVESELDRLRKKVENFPSASLYNRLAELARNAGAADEAEAVCQKCMKEFPRNGQAYVIMAELEHARGKKADALSLLQTAIER